MSDPGDLVIATQGLRKEFSSVRRGHHVAVQDLDLAVPRGGVHGFLGPNGSGKTTTIRMLLGLARPSAGSMTLLGEPVPSRLPVVMGRVGAVVESPKFSPGFTGRQNLLLLSRSIGAPDRRVDEAMETVGLRERGPDRYRGYSLGMKQRLAIAATLLKEPELLILDEPTNGLDPAGIREIRETIRDLGSSGVTVLLSSHILAEVQQVCDAATIIGRGRMLASGRVADLVAGTDAASWRVRATDQARLDRALAGAGVAARLDTDPDARVVETDDPAGLNQALGRAGVWLTELAPLRRDLETVFLELTSADTLGNAADPGDP